MNTLPTALAPITPAERNAVPAKSGPESSGFSDLMSGILGDAVSALKTAEQTSSAALEGKASIQQVVDAVLQAERQLQTALAVRDKIVAAYLDLQRTQI
jgi:flagellar hook-basal body complex protein FliE